MNMTTADLDSLRDTDGKLPAYAWPGGYPIFYLDTEHNVLCPSCANKEGYSAEVSCQVINWEDESCYCDDCSTRIESAYGEKED